MVEEPSHVKQLSPNHVCKIGLSPSKFGNKISSFADLGCLSRILDPGSECFPSRIQDPGSKFFPAWIPDPRFECFPSRILEHNKEFKYFNQKNGFSVLRNIIQVFHPGSGSRIWILTIYLSQIPILDPRSRIQGSKWHRIPDPGSRIRIRNTGDFVFAQAVGGSIGY